MLRFIVSSFVFIVIFTNFESAVGRPEYTEKEKAALIKFRELVKDATYKDYMMSDPYLIRWIRAKDFDLNGANEMLRTALKWRKQNKIDGILDETVYEFQSKPYYLDGVDKEGSGILVMLPTRVDMRKILLNGKRSEAIRFWDQLIERIEQDIMKTLGVVGNSSDPTRDRADLYTVIMDMHGYSLRQHATLGSFGVYLEWFEHMERYYPGYTKHFFIINAPRIAIPLIELLKPVMSAQTRNALKVYGTNKAEWQKAIIGKIIPPDQVRVNLGGTKPE